VNDICFRPDGAQLVAAVGNRVLVYDAADGDLLRFLRVRRPCRPCRPARLLAFRPLEPLAAASHEVRPL